MARPPADARRILIRLPNWLGDALMSRPLLHALRGRFPAAEIRATGPAPLLELLAAERTFDRGLPWPTSSRARSALARELSAWGPDLALVLPPSLSSAWFARRTAARVRIGFAHEGRSALLTHAVRRPARGERHQSLEYLDLAASLGVGETPSPALALPPDAHARAAALIAAHAARVADGAPIALLAPGAQYGPAKRWGAERFAALGRAVSARGAAVLVCGGAAERDTCAEVVRAIGGGAALLAGATDLLAQAGVCARAGLAVCNDSGLAHLAAAVGAPTVAIFGSTSSAWTAPLGQRVRIVQRPPVCSPCFQRTCAIGLPCMSAIAVAEVLEACAALAGPALAAAPRERAT